MTVVSDSNVKLQAVLAKLDVQDAKLDELRAFVATLKAGQVSAEELSTLVSLTDALDLKSSKVLAEVEGELPAPTPTPEPVPEPTPEA